MSETRIPTQKRSIEKRNKIIEKGFILMCEKGYYNTNTSEIADYAGVSTGIIYQYFNDKREIFVEGVKNYAGKIMYPMFSILENEKIDANNMESIIKNMIEKFIKTHTISKKAHEELIASQHLDEDVANVFKEYEIEMTDKIVALFKNNNIEIDNPREKIHIIMAMIDNLCHEIVYHKHSEINYDVMIKEVITIVVNIINNYPNNG